MKNPYRRPDHRQAHDQAIKLAQQGLDRFAISKALDHNIPRWKRQQIAAKAVRMTGINKR